MNPTSQENHRAAYRGRAPALEGIEILALSHVPPVAYCTMMLGDLGANVIDVMPPNFPPQSPVRVEEEKWAAYDAHLRNKRNLVLDLKNRDALGVLYKLAARADVIVEGFRPGVARRLGVDYETVRAINHGIVYCSLSGFGQDGPYCQMPGHDINFISIGGALGMIGEPDGRPILPSNLLGDFAGAGLHGTVGILAALMSRQRSGQGQYIDLAYIDGVISLMAWEASIYFASGIVPKRGRTIMTGSTPYYNTYATKDGKFISIGCVETHLWRNLCVELGCENFVSSQFNEEEFDEIGSFLKQEFLTRDRDEWFDLLKDKNVPISPVYDLDEVFSDPQVLHRRMLLEGKHPKFGTVRQAGLAIKLSDTAAELRKLGAVPGEHTNEILAELGYGEEEVGTLRARGAVT